MESVPHWPADNTMTTKKQNKITKQNINSLSFSINFISTLSNSAKRGWFSTLFGCLFYSWLCHRIKMNDFATTFRISTQVVTIKEIEKARNNSERRKSVWFDLNFLLDLIHICSKSVLIFYCNLVGCGVGRLMGRVRECSINKVGPPLLQVIKGFRFFCLSFGCISRDLIRFDSIPNISWEICKPNWKCDYELKSLNVIGRWHRWLLLLVHVLLLLCLAMATKNFFLSWLYNECV